MLAEPTPAAAAPLLLPAGLRFAHVAFHALCQSKELILAKDDPKTSIDAGGLRYRSKVAGSPFSATGAFGAATMSCFLCGKHRPRAQLKSRKLLGKAQAVCAPSCKELEAALAAGTTPPAAKPSTPTAT